MLILPNPNPNPNPILNPNPNPVELVHGIAVIGHVCRVVSCPRSDGQDTG